MALDRSFLEHNRFSQQRLRDLAARLSDEELKLPVGQHWTVAIVFAHLAFWDRRVLYVLDETEREGRLVVPELGIVANDISLPLWAAIPPREAVRLALQAAGEVDRRLENYPPALLEEIQSYNPRWVDRSLHRTTHLDEAEESIKS